MKKLNKKGFTLVELLAVIVLLAIVGVAGMSAISKMLSNSKRTNFVTSYNDVYQLVASKLALGEDPSTTSAADYDLSDTDYTLTITSSGEYYEIALEGKGTYNTLKLDESNCNKRKGRNINGGGSCSDKKIVGYIQ